MKADARVIEPVRAYFNRARAYKVTHFAVMYKMDDIPFYALIPTDEFERRLIQYYDKLIQIHDGFRLQPLKGSMRTTARNLPMRSLIMWLHTHCAVELPDATGESVFEKRVTSHIGGEWKGEKVSEYDIEMQDGTRIECKGIQSTVYFDSWETSEYRL